MPNDLEEDEKRMVRLVGYVSAHLGRFQKEMLAQGYSKREFKTAIANWALNEKD